MDLKDNNEENKIGENKAEENKAEKKSFKDNRVLVFLKKKLKLIIILIILIIAGVTAFQVNAAVEEAKMSEEATTQNFEEVSSQDISNSIAVTGTIVSNETRTLSTLVSNTEVEEVYVEVGDYVKVGDPICTFDTSSIESNIAKLEREIQVNNAKATLELAKANTQVAWAWEDYYDNQSDGQFDLNSAMISYQQQQNSVADAIAELEDRERSLDDARDKYHDYKKAKRDGTVSENSKLDSSMTKSDYKENIRDAEDAVASASRNLQNAQLSLENTINSYNQTVEKLRDQGRTDLRTISNNMVAVIETKLNNMTTNDEAEEKIRDYEDNLDNCNITAPISGVVTSVSVVEGDEYDEKSTICVIQDDSSYKVSGTVDQYDIADITESMNCVIKTDATGDDQMEGILTFVSPVPGSASSSSQSSGSNSNSNSTSSSSSTEYPIEITINGRDERLRIGMTAEASILVESRENAKVVPYDAIEEGDDGKFFVNVAQSFGKPSGDTEKSSEDKEKPSGSFEIPSAGAEKASTEASSEESTEGEKPDHPDLPEGADGELPEMQGSPTKTSYSANPLANLIAGKIIGQSAEEHYMTTAERATKKVEVKKGLESDYYTEIISDDIEVGDEVLISESESSSDDLFGGGMGGPGHGPGGPRGGF